MKNSKIQKLKKRGSTLLLLVLFMCVLATVVAVILVSSPAVDAQYKTVGCMVIDKKNAVIAADGGSVLWYSRICDPTSCGKMMETDC